MSVSVLELAEKNLKNETDELERAIAQQNRANRGSDKQWRRECRLYVAERRSAVKAAAEEVNFIKEIVK